jgi:hypothetical protein
MKLVSFSYSWKFVHRDLWVWLKGVKPQPKSGLDKPIRIPAAIMTSQEKQRRMGSD